MGRDSKQRAPELMVFRMGRLMHALRLTSEDRLRPQAFTMKQAVLLLILNRAPGLSSAELARLLSVTPQAMGEQLAELEAMKLMERTPDSANRRKLVARLTPDGRKKAAACRAVMAAIEEDMLSALGKSERTVLESLLDRCFEKMSAALPRASQGSNVFGK